ncbi:hypothetical protein RND81_14G180500 [Saponaria officinalis]|uniref:RNase H type-1 domain-containing protein n=1 Tax=Saponaria officinalis TaxID=3572 RepID=A0AAW1GU29_SAPOF
MKINADATIFENGDDGLGFVCLDESGSVRVGSKRVKVRWHPEIAEAKTVDMAKEGDMQCIVFESDSLSVVLVVNLVKSRSLSRCPLGLCIYGICLYLIVSCQAVVCMLSVG